MPGFVGVQGFVIACIFVAFILELFVPPVPISRVPIAWPVYRVAWTLLHPFRWVFAKITGRAPPRRPHPRVRIPLSFAVAFFFSWLALFVVFMPWLTALQLMVAWATYGLLNLLRQAFRMAVKWREAHQRTSDQLRQFAREADENLRKSVEAALDSAAEVIRGRAHRRALENAIDDAQHSLCIVSGWINDRAVDLELLTRIEAAAQRGVRVFIGFGVDSRNGRGPSPQQESETRRAVVSLAVIGQRHPVNGRPSVSIGWISTHEKVLVVDDAYVIVGSNNWLSNSSFVNSESSVRYSSRALAHEFSKDIARRTLEAPYVM